MKGDGGTTQGNYHRSQAGNGKKKKKGVRKAGGMTGG